MIAIDVKNPTKCESCPFVRFVDYGIYRGRWICRALEAKGKTFTNSLVESISSKNVDCPIIEIGEYQNER